MLGNGGSGACADTRALAAADISAYRRTHGGADTGGGNSPTDGCTHEHAHIGVDLCADTRMDERAHTLVDACPASADCGSDISADGVADVAADTLATAAPNGADARLRASNCQSRRASDVCAAEPADACARSGADEGATAHWTLFERRIAGARAVAQALRHVQGAQSHAPRQGDTRRR